MYSYQSNKNDLTFKINENQAIEDHNNLSIMSESESIVFINFIKVFKVK